MSLQGGSLFVRNGKDNWNEIPPPHPNQYWKYVYTFADRIFAIAGLFELIPHPFKVIMIFKTQMMGASIYGVIMKNKEIIPFQPTWCSIHKI